MRIDYTFHVELARFVFTTTFATYYFDRDEIETTAYKHFKDDYPNECVEDRLEVHKLYARDRFDVFHELTHTFNIDPLYIKVGHNIYYKNENK
jgi:hypothetical protein